MRKDHSEAQEGRLTDPVAARRFVLGGNAIFTIRSVKTGTRFTYKVTAGRPKEGETESSIFFVALLTGPENESDYAYLGHIFTNDPLTYRHGKKSRIGVDAPSAAAFAWFWRQLGASRLPASVEVWHEGRCGRCGRTLTVPESIASGFGPECATRV